jgi:hypothetical protein
MAAAAAQLDVLAALAAFAAAADGPVCRAEFVPCNPDGSAAGPGHLFPDWSLVVHQCTRTGLHTRCILLGDTVTL